MPPKTQKSHLFRINLPDSISICQDLVRDLRYLMDISGRGCQEFENWAWKKSKSTCFKYMVASRNFEVPTTGQFCFLCSWCLSSCFQLDQNYTTLWYSSFFPPWAKNTLHCEAMKMSCPKNVFGMSWFFHVTFLLETAVLPGVLLFQLSCCL